MLYAYWPAGTVEWDDVIVKQIAPAPPRKGEKDRRPSTETKVRTREMQEDPVPPARSSPAKKRAGSAGDPHPPPLPFSPREKVPRSGG